MDKETKQMFELVLKKLEGIDQRQDRIEKRLVSMEERLMNVENRQDEMYNMQRGLEENVKVIMTQQEKMMYILTDIQGKLTKLTQEVDEHETVIRQIRAIK